jgi:hypothetical protein
MKNRQEWLKELDLRQRNVDPIGRIPNVASFQGALIKGSRRLNGPQRVAAVVIGCCGLLFGCVSVALLVGGLMSDASGLELLYRVLYLPFGILFFYFGFKIVINAVVNEPAKRSSSHVDSSGRQ